MSFALKREIIDGLVTMTLELVNINKNILEPTDFRIKCNKIHVFVVQFKNKEVTCYCVYYTSLYPTSNLLDGFVHFKKLLKHYGSHGCSRILNYIMQDGKCD